MGNNIRKVTILHSNDIHGNFAGRRDAEGKLYGSIAQTAGYINKVKEEEDNVIYCIAGDIFQGSLIDSEFRGISTIDIMNFLPIDVMSLGNHELDYGISHMLFLDKWSECSVINANFRNKYNQRFLFDPYKILEIDGVKVLFIGLLTKDIIETTNSEGIVGKLVEVHDPKEEVERICHQVKDIEGIHIDHTVLMTHIGHEEDLKLAASLDPKCGVNMIIGGHSHTYIDEPAIVNDILVVTAGMDNTHIGRIDLTYDYDVRKRIDFKWEMVPIDEEHCPTDKMVYALVSTYVLNIHEKYDKVVTTLSRKLDNYGRRNPTECGQMFSDAFCDALGLDIFLLASSSVRCYSMEKIVTIQSLKECYPYEGKIFRLDMNGKTLKAGLKHALRDEVLDNGVEVFFQASKDLHIEYNRTTKDIKLWFKGEPVEDDKIYKVGMQEFYYLNSEIGLGMKPAELSIKKQPAVVAVSACETIKEYLLEHTGLGGPIDDRIIIRE